jgi:hypothetical protein
MLTDTDIKRMQTLYAKRFGIQLEKEEARNQLSLLVQQVQLTYRPITAIQLQRLTDEDNKANEVNEINHVKRRSKEV